MQFARQVFQTPLFELGGQPISLIWVGKLLIALLAVGIATRFIKNVLKHRILVRLGIDSGNREAIATLVSIGLGAFGYVIVLQATGVDLSSVAVIIGGLGVGIGFGLQDITKNLLSGLTILVEQKLRVGDFVEFDDIEGYIEEISIRSTVIRTLAGGEVMIPNAQLAEERITNWSYRNLDGRLELPIGVAYGSDPVLVTETLLDAAYSQAEILSHPPPKVIFAGFGDSSLNFELWAWTHRIDRRDFIKSDVMFTIEYYLRRKNITIPFPQLDLWMRSPNGLSDGLSNRAPDEGRAANPQKDDDTNLATEPTHPNTLRTWLSQISYFQHFNELQMRSLIELGYRKQLATSETLIRQGALAREFCIVLTGAIGAFHESNHQEKQLFTFEAGQYFGELPLMLGVPYPTTMKAMSNTILFMVDAHGFEKLLRDYPALAEDIAQELSNRREVLDGYHQELLMMGFSTDTESNPVAWIRRRLKELFTQRSS
ncbi:MAG: mechanosensitive ion channel domain-containing protein [Cyanobacteria bacterium P01_E01_bin.6]